MRKTRILVIGEFDALNRKGDEEIESPETKKVPLKLLDLKEKRVVDLEMGLHRPLCILDYNIVIVDLPTIDMIGSMDILKGFKTDFFDFFQARGLLVVLSDIRESFSHYIQWPDHKVELRFQTYSWLPVKVRVHRKAGKSVTFNTTNRIGKVLRDDDFKWECIFETKWRHEVVAENPAGKSVALEIRAWKGRVILLPMYEDRSVRDANVRKVLDMLKKDYLGKGERVILRPRWIGDYAHPGEKDAVKKLQVAQETVKKFESAKGLLYLDDRELTDAICTVLGEMGYQTKNLELERRHDVELRYKDSFGLLEAKGLKKHAKVGDMRQLSDHYSQRIEDAEEKGEEIEVKGIFVVNHFREEHPRKRAKPYTKEAERVGERDGFCLMTTVQLHQMHSDSVSGKLKLKDIHKRIWETEGVLEDQ